MIHIETIDREHRQDLLLPNEPFALTGRMALSYTDGQWRYEVRHFPPEQVGEMCFPDEGYDFDAMEDSVFLGAYDGEKCVGLAVLQPGCFKYMYLYDLKVCRAYRGRKIASLLMDEARKLALEKGFRGLYTQGQDNNAGAWPACSTCITAFGSAGWIPRSTRAPGRKERRIFSFILTVDFRTARVRRRMDHGACQQLYA